MPNMRLSEIGTVSDLGTITILTPWNIVLLEKLTGSQLVKKLPGFYPLNAELNPVSHLLAFLGVYHIFHVSRIRVMKP